jgi:hypothetical protein
MKLKFIEIKEFDIKEERIRINKCFKGKLKKQLILILENFSNGEFVKCIENIGDLGYDTKHECKESEYVHPFIYNTIVEMIGNSNLKVEVII